MSDSKIPRDSHIYRALDKIGTYTVQFFYSEATVHSGSYFQISVERIEDLPETSFISHSFVSFIFTVFVMNIYCDSLL